MTASFHFRAQDLWIEGELLGATINLVRDGRRCSLNFPADHDSFGLDRGSEEMALGGWSGTQDNPRQRAAVRTIQVAVEIAADYTAQDVSAADRETFEAIHRLLAEAAAVAKGLISDLFSWVRAAKGQFWLEPLSVEPQITWMTDVRDGSGDRLPTGYHDPMRVHAQRGPGLTRADVDEVLARAADGEQPDLPAELLADAQFYAWRASEPNPRIAILLAAVAAEVRVKTFLTERASPAQSPLVDLILSNPRDVSIAAVSLFDKGLHAVMGRSFRIDDPEGYQALRRLFESRNRVAHRGDTTTIDNDSLAAGVGAASRASEYPSTL